MDQIEKFLRKIEKKLALRLMVVLQNIAVLKLDTYDVEKLKGFDHYYRIRVGKIRIIFVKAQGKGIPIYIEFRGRIYQKYYTCNAVITRRRRVVPTGVQVMRVRRLSSVCWRISTLSGLTWRISETL